jgi:Asp-tRNA(Asn)/Glu-tRNA(Gln) amidotransferase C subunit
MDRGRIQTKEEYRTFIGELEEILAYLTKMNYEDVNAASGKPLWKAISTEMQRDVAKELAHDKKLKKTKDGKALVPNLEVLKYYVEASLSVYDLDVGITKAKPTVKESENKREVQAKTKSDNGTDKVKALEEEIKKLHTEMNTNQTARPFPPHFSASRPPNSGFRPPGPGGPSFPRPQLQCFYCKEMDHTSMFCQHLNEDIAKRLVFKQGPNFYYPNREVIPTDTGNSI